MKQNSDSDYNPVMLANNAFEAVIDQIRNSNLNFHLQMSPFSAQISLKKSLVTDKTGVPRLPPTIHPVNGSSNFNIGSLAAKNVQLESDLNALKIQYAHAVKVCDEAHAKLKYLEAEVASTTIKQENDDDVQGHPVVVEALQHEIDELKIVNMKYEENNKVHIEKISELETSVKIKTDIANQLNKKLTEVKLKADKENSAIKKSFKAEIKSWRKELGEERKAKLKLEEELEKMKNEHHIKELGDKGRKKVASKSIIPGSDQYKAEILCSLCGTSIPEFIPEYFCGEKFNPACQACKACDSSWDPDDPFSAFPLPAPPASLVSHWLHTPRQQEPQNPNSINSFISHLVSSTDDEEKMIHEDDFKKWMAEFREQLRADRIKILAELRQDFNLFKGS